MRNYTYICAAVLLCAAHTWAHQAYQTSLPNGKQVPNVCTKTLWPGVGHLASGGGGARNDFGKAFAGAGKQWTKALCEADSDGDGRSNGAELGDPECTWKTGGTPACSAGLSHPGIKETFKGAGCTANSASNCACETICDGKPGSTLRAQMSLVLSIVCFTAWLIK